MGNSFILKGNICHTPRLGSLEIREHACIVCAEGTCRGIFDNISQIPEQYRALEVIDCGDRLVLPGMVDLHIHAPQYAFRGTGMDYELLKWLDRVTFPEEIRYADTGYAARAYEIFSNGLKKGATTRAVIFGTIHVRSTLILMDCMEKSGLISFVGKVNMDRHAPPELTEKSVSEAEADTRLFIEETRKRTGADYILVLMSSYFTQRGEAAVLDPYRRAEAAIACGADAVLGISMSMGPEQSIPILMGTAVKLEKE